MSTADIIILIGIGIVLFFVLRAMVKAKKKGQCIGCTESCCSHSCSGCSGRVSHEHSENSK